MKITAIKGSARTNGSSSTLFNEFKRGAEEAGHTFEVFETARLTIHPCIGCERCEMDGPCTFSDDNSKIRDSILSSDMVVFVTPLYYFGFASQIKAVIDRFYSYTIKLSNKGLKSALIATAWNDDDETMSYLKEHYEKLSSYLNFENVGEILALGSKTPSITRSSKYMAEAYNLGKSLR